MKKSDVEELRTYRQAKASGRLFIVPEGLKDGTSVWTIDHDGNRVVEHMIIEWVILTGRLFGKIVVSDDGETGLFTQEDFGITVFKTKDEAESVLNGIAGKEVEEESIVSDNG